ncbi:MAG: ABC-F family ATP-binding cassette domain-containing protein [Bacteroidales bacterium]
MGRISLLQAENISKRYGDLLLFENISLGISEGDKTALIAKNGTGKSTILGILAGEEVPDEGKVTKRNDLRIGYLPQDIILDSGKSVMDAVFSLSSPTMNAVRDYQKALSSDDPEHLQSCMDAMDSHNAWDTELKVKQVLSSLKITQTEKRLGMLSGGEQKRVALAAVLLEEPDLLILDEPTNHLDLSMIEWLEQFLMKSGKSLLMVTHDRYFLDRVCNTILELDDNRIYPYKGNYSYYLQKRQERKANEMANAEKAANLLKTEEEWMRRMPKARGTKAKFREDNYYELKEKARKKQDDQLHISVPSTRLGRKVFDLHDVSKGYDNKLLFKNFNYKFVKGEKVGIVGDNGSGKTTFLELLAGTIKPDTGRIETGSTLKLAYYRQDGLAFDENERVIDAISKIAEAVDLGKDKVFTARQFLLYFMFPVEKQQQKISRLSGGEKRRLYLCSVLIKKPNFLILDEPTNDLDIISLQVLEDYLMNFDGCVLIVSHDRYFMDKIVDHLFVFDGQGTIKDFPGNYSVYRSAQEEKEMIDKYRASKQRQKDKPAFSGTPKNSYRNRLSYKEKREYEQLEKDISRLTEQKNEVEKAMNSGTLEADELMKASKEFSALTDELDEKEMRWLELSERS